MRIAWAYSSEGRLLHPSARETTREATSVRAAITVGAYTPAPLDVRSNAEEEWLAGIGRGVRVGALLGAGLDVGLHAEVLHGPGLGVAGHEAGAVVVVAGLTDRADGDDVLVPPSDSELLGHHVVHL